ncbi:hypothetical protein KOR42_23000 [Thalassoglobus neptunius]|uniref:Uncharacterized protein n=1 Tax=Thalassoglobus neptunius TaxID=1938619 RepID=A0A5C5X9C5_9PLAN|nr:hypothetical protein [Thalassoglobus neptunius]TWT58913.1 hypothetical protein KOR42_23000 [Thalassoglobus neptunius]
MASLHTKYSVSLNSMVQFSRQIRRLTDHDMEAFERFVKWLDGEPVAMTTEEIKKLEYILGGEHRELDEAFTAWQLEGISREVAEVA